LRRVFECRAAQGEQAGSAGGDERDDQLVQALELAVGELRAPSQLAQRDPGGVAHRAAGAGPQRGRLGHQGGYGVPANRVRRSSGPVTIRDLAWPLVWVRPARALRLATISARIASTEPSRPSGAPRARPDCAARAALTASSGPGLALPAPVLPAERPASTTRTPTAARCRARPAP
jgi:hypothetical protein